MLRPYFRNNKKGRRFLGRPVLRLHLDILSNGFDEHGNFIYIPIRDLSEMKEYFRHLVINHFKDAGLLSHKMARNLLSWKHSGRLLHVLCPPGLTEGS